MKLPTSKLPHIGTTIFTKMSQLAHEHQAINLSQGFPNYSPDPVLLEEVSKALHNGKNQYAPLQGIFLCAKPYAISSIPFTEVIINLKLILPLPPVRLKLFLLLFLLL